MIPDAPLTPAQGDHAGLREPAWCAPSRRYELPDDQHSIADFRAHLKETFAIPISEDGLQLSVDGYALLPDAAVTILRDDDLISVTAPAPGLPAVAKGRRKRPLPAADLTKPVKKRRTAAKSTSSALDAPPAPAAAITSRQDPSEQASSSSEAASLEHGGMPMPCASCFYTGAGWVIGRAPTMPCFYLCADGAEPQEETETPKASRNARRKAAKRRLRREGVLPYKGRSGGSQPARLAAAKAADPLDPNKSTAAALVVPLSAAPASAARAGPPGSQKHIHFEQSDGDEPAASLAANGSLPQQPTQNKSTAHGAHSPAAALPAPAAVTPAPAAILPSPAASAPAALQRAVSANGSAPALRANTLAEVFAARGHATEAHANGRSSPHVGATSKQPDPDHLPQQNGFVHRQQKRRSVREPQVSHDQLPALQRPPQLGDVISYKLLEIGADYSPQVSKTSTQDN